MCRGHTGEATWASAISHGALASRQWLKHVTAVEPLDVRPPTRSAGSEDQIQLVAMIKESLVDQVLRASSRDGVFTRTFFESDEDRAMYRVIPLEEGTTLQAAQSKAAWLGDASFGVVTTRRGLAIRVKAGDFERVVKQVRPDDSHKLLGSKWEVSGLPLAMSADALGAFLHPWVVHPVYTYRQGMRRTWVVQATESPGATKVQHDFGLAVIQEARPRPTPAERPKVERWQPPAKSPQRNASNAPRSWADVTREKPAAIERQGDAEQAGTVPREILSHR